MKSLLQRYHWLVIAVAVFVVLIVAADLIDLNEILPRSQGTGFTSTDSEKIKLGMSEKEVIRVLGGGPGNYPKELWAQTLAFDRLPVHEPGCRYEMWVSGTGVIFVDFDENDSVARVSFQKPTLTREGFLRRLLKMLGVK